MSLPTSEECIAAWSHPWLSRQKHQISDAITKIPIFINILKTKHDDITVEVSTIMFSWSMIVMTAVLIQENV